MSRFSLYSFVYFFTFRLFRGDARALKRGQLPAFPAFSLTSQETILLLSDLYSMCSWLWWCACVCLCLRVV